MHNRCSRFKLFLIAACLLPAVCLSQQSSFWKKSLFGARGYYGSFLTTKAKAEYIRDSYSSYGEIYFAHQTTGKHDWEITHHYPQWGISFLYGNSGSRQYIGKVMALYSWLHVSVIRARKYSGSLLVGAGPGWISKPYDIYTNPKNALLGTKFNAYINLVFTNNFNLSKHFGLDAGIGFMHMSNGGTTLPNLGLNTPVVFIGTKYAFSNRIEVNRAIKESFKKKIEYKAYTSIALKQAPWVGGNHYAINVVQTEAAYHFKRNHSFGTGLMFTYNRSLDFYPLDNLDEPHGKKKFQMGAYGAYEHHFGRLSMPLNLGVYLYNKAKAPQLFQQFGLRYAASKHISTEIMLKSHMGAADFIHAGIGYVF